MQEIELPAGIIEYEDTGGSGPVVVLLHGLAMEARCGAMSSASCVPTTAA